VETAVKLAQAAEGFPEQLKLAEPVAVALAAEVLDVPTGELEPVLETVLEVEEGAAPEPASAASSPAVAAPPQATAAAAQDEAASAQPAPFKRPLFWSVAHTEGGEAQKPAEAEGSHVPPVLRNLQKCQVCGFPVSAGRVLCVECEEKKWRGQLRTPRAGVVKPASGPVPGPTARAFAAAQAAAGSVAVAQPKPAVDTTVATAKPATFLSGPPDVSKTGGGSAVPPASTLEPTLSSAAPDKASQAAGTTPPAPSPEVVFGSGLGSSQSWLAANKYILGVLLVAAAAVAVIVLLR